MRAAILESLNAPLRIAEVPDPVAGTEEVIVSLKAAALNRRDFWIQKGQYAGIQYPLIPGSDGAGIVTEIGPDTNPDWLGKEVILNPSHNWGTDERFQSKQFQILGLPANGTFAERVCIHSQYLALRLYFQTWEESAALPLAGLTAYRALFIRAGLKAGEKVLITGAGGGVAAIAISMAVAAGAVVFVTSGSEEKLSQAVALGANGGVNYRIATWVEDLKKISGGFDVILDGTGGEGFAGLADLAAPGGRIAMYGGTNGSINGLSSQRIFWKQLSILGSTMGSPSDFKEMLAFVNEKKIRPAVDQVFSLNDAEKAMRKMDAASQFGKIVLAI